MQRLLHSPLQLLSLWGSWLLIPSCRPHVPQAAEASNSRCLTASAKLLHKTCRRTLLMGTLSCKMLLWKVEGISRGMQGKLASIWVQSCLVSQEQAFPFTLSLSQLIPLIWFNNIQAWHAKSSFPALKSFIGVFLLILLGLWVWFVCFKLLLRKGSRCNYYQRKQLPGLVLRRGTGLQAGWFQGVQDWEIRTWTQREA